MAHGWYEISSDQGKTWSTQFMGEKDILEQIEKGSAVRKNAGNSRYIIKISYSGIEETLLQYYVTHDEAWKAAQEEAMKHIIEINAYAGLSVSVFCRENRIELSYGEGTTCTYSVEKSEAK